MNGYIGSMTKTWSRKRRPASERFWEKVDKNGPLGRGRAVGRCWQWTASLDAGGYGQFGTGEGKRVIKAYRWAWESVNGARPEGRQLDHVCRNHACVRPSHLEAVTQRENLLRGETIPARNALRTHCPSGHPYAGENLYITPSTGQRRCRHCDKVRQRIEPDAPRVAYLGDSKKAEIRSRYAAGGVKQSELADIYGIHRVTVSNIVRQG